MSGTVAAKKPLLTQEQQQLYARLVRAFPGSVILAQVALASQCVAEFVVCRPDFTALAVVELEMAPAHRGASREKNHRKDQFLASAGIKIIRVIAGDLPNEVALKALVAALPVRAPAPRLMRHAG